MSLSNEGNAILDGVPIADIVKNGECLILTLICKVARGEEYSNKFDIDFQAIISENRECRIPIQIQAIQLGLSEREATWF
jgi:hypothetical protein